MSDASQSLVVKIKVNSDGLIEGMSAAGKAASGASQTITESFRSAGRSASQASQEHEGFNETLRSFKKEAAGSAKVAGFYANKLDEVIPGASGAKSAVKGLIAAMLEGGGIGAGIEVAVVAFGQLREMIDEEHARASELRKVHREAFAAVEDGVRSAAHAYAAWHTATEGVERSLQEGVTVKVRALREQIDEIHAKTKESFFGDVFGSDAGKIQSLASQMRALQNSVSGRKGASLLDALQAKETLSEMERVAHEGIRITAEMGTEEFRIKTETSEKTHALDLKIGAATAKGLTDLAATYVTEKEQLETQSAEKVRRLRIAATNSFNSQSLALSRDTMNAESAAYVESSNRIDALKAQLAAGGTARERARIATLIKLEEEAATRIAGLAALNAENARRATIINAQKTLDAETQAKVTQLKAVQSLEAQLATSDGGNLKAARIQATRDTEQAEALIVREAYAKHLISAEQLEADLVSIRRKGSEERGKIVMEENKWAVAGMQGVAKGFSTAIAGMITAQKSLGSAIASVGKAILASMLDVVEKIVMGNAIRAASAAFADTAQEGIFGLIAAPAAMAAAFGIVQGLVSSIPSASGGYDIPRGVNPVTQLHSEEMVLPKAQANAVRDMAAGGGPSGSTSGGGDIHVHIHSAYADAASVRAFVASREFRLGIKDAQRNGVL